MGGGGQAQSRARAEAPSELPRGTAVAVRGLVGAAQHNGKLGKVEDYDEGSSRYVVALDDGDDALRIKCEAEPTAGTPQPCTGRLI